MPCDVLNLEWASSGRDREVASAVCHTLRSRGFRVVEGSIFNYRRLIVRHRPRLLYLADPTGARTNYQVALFAERLGIPAISIDAEGNYREDGAEQMLWGHIADRRLHERIKLQWSERARQLSLAVAPELSGRLKVTGAVGFDRYRLYSFASKDDWRSRYGFSQRRVVGFASWAFDRVRAFSALNPNYDASRFLGDRDAVRELLAILARRQPETLFLLKEHPGVVDLQATEIAGLDGLENVLRIRDEESIGDCINVCDVWMAYESTTCIEAWLLGKPTLFINPSGGDFPRSNVHEGTPVLETLDAVDDALARHAATGRIEEFEAKREGRRRVLGDVVQWTDGKNHLRAAYFFEQVLDEVGDHAGGFSPAVRLAALRHDVLFRGARYVPWAPGFRHYAPARRRFDLAQLARVQARAAAAIDACAGELSDEELAELEQMNA